MAIWVGKQKMSCRSCIKGHRSSTCNHIGGPLWAVRPAGRPNKACIHGPGDLCLCRHYFPLTWLKAAVPRNKKCSCQGSGRGRKCSCGTKSAPAAAVPDDDTQPVFYQDLVARGLHVTSEPVELEVPAAPAPASCCGVRAPAPIASPAPPPVAASCCSAPATSTSTAPKPAPVTAPAPSSCCSGPVKSEPQSVPVTPGANGHIKSEPPFTPVQQYPPASDIAALLSHHHSPVASGADHSCECGPSCNCVLCIDHPYNNATMNHIATEFGHMMTDGNGASFSPTNGHNDRFNELFAHAWASQNGMMPPGFSDLPDGLPSAIGAPQTHSPPSQATELDIILNPADFQMFNFALPSLDEPDTFDPPLNVDLDLGTALPEIDMNGYCGGMPEGCPCGDDCACIGCQIHKPDPNGHRVEANGWS